MAKPKLDEGETRSCAPGWLVCPEGERISHVTRADAERCIAEYAAKLGETWSFVADDAPVVVEADDVADGVIVDAQGRVVRRVDWMVDTFWSGGFGVTP